jgi:DNA sulfur modification protein DndB
VAEARIDNVIRTVAQGVEQYLGFFSARELMNMLMVKSLNAPSGEGYQRSANLTRVRRMRRYLKQHQRAILPTVLLNIDGRWEFVPYSLDRPDHGYLICHGPASIIDGQHRIEGIRRYLGRSRRKDILVPFQALANLSSQEEIETFQTINSQARPITKSHIQYLRRKDDELAWVAAQSVQDPLSPLGPITSVEGVRRRDKGVRLTLQYVHKAVSLMCEGPKMKVLPKEPTFRARFRARAIFDRNFASRCGIQ